MSDAAAKDDPEDVTQELPEGFDRRHTTRARPYTFLEPPAVMKRLFARFPLRTEPAERRPLSSLPAAPVKTDQTLHLDLWLMTHSDDPRAPSFDLDCLRYQTFLHARRIKFDVRRAERESAPDGQLPFIMATTSSAPTTTAAQKTKRSTTLIRRREIETFVALREKKNKKKDGAEAPTTATNMEEKVREQLGISLIERQLRPAWLYATYLRADNFASATSPLYVEAATSSGIARAALAYELRAQATAELSRSAVTAPELLLARSSPSNAETLGRRLNGQAHLAANELVRMLGDDMFFSGADAPGFLDAALFAYTHLLLQHEVGGRLEETSRDMLGEGATLERIRRHERDVYGFCYGDQ